MEEFSAPLFSVSELNGYVSALITSDERLKSVRVEGEISGFKRHTSGHLYFSLKDENALVRCVMFRQQAARLRFDPSDGMHVVLYGSASIYEKSGDFQLYARYLSKRGEGELYARFLQLKARLDSEGLFSEAHKRKIPFLPRRVGVITSETGAALQDVLNVLHRRFPHMPVVIRPVPVQGDGAAAEIAQAIREMNAARAADVLIVGRGGGSIEELWAFNEIEVARALFESEIPTVSAVGHETDFTIADFVADLRAPTPSAAAELCVPEEEACRAAIDALNERMRRAVQARMERMRATLRLYQSARAFRMLENRVYQGRQTLEYASERLHRAMRTRVKNARDELLRLSEKAEVMSPAHVLERGYAIVTDDQGAPVSSALRLAAGQNVNLMLHDGKAAAQIKDIEIGGVEHGKQRTDV